MHSIFKQAYNQCHQAELGKLSPFLKNTQKSRHLTQSVVAGVIPNKWFEIYEINFEFVSTY